MDKNTHFMLNVSILFKLFRSMRPCATLMKIIKCAFEL